MVITTLFRFLIGSQAAICRVAAAPAALWVGLLFVLSAGLAREYDTESLVHEPWHLLLPLAVVSIWRVVLIMRAASA